MCRFVIMVVKVMRILMTYISYFFSIHGYKGTKGKRNCNSLLVVVALLVVVNEMLVDGF